MKKLTGSRIGLHFMRKNRIFIDTAHGLIYFPHLTMQVKTASSETTTKPQPVITVITSELEKNIWFFLSDACELVLKQPTLGKQLLLMTDASFRIAGYALMIEDNLDQELQSKQKTYASVAFGSKIFLPEKLKMSIYSKEVLARYMPFLELAHYLWATTKPTIALTDNKSITRFFPNEGYSASTVEWM